MYELEPLSPYLKEELLTEFETNEEKLQRDVKSLAEWMEKQPHLPDFKDEKFLRCMLLMSKNRMEKAKYHLEYYFMGKSLLPEIFKNCDVEREGLKRAYDLISLIPLQKLTADGTRIILYFIDQKPGVPLPSTEDYLKMLYIMCMYYLYSADCSKQFICFCDFRRVSMAYVSFVLATLKKVLLITWKMMPGRRGKIYMLNMPKIFDSVTSVMAKLYKDHEKRAVYWKGDYKQLAELFPKEVLPIDYGGTEESIEELKNLFYEEMIKKKDWFQEQEKFVADLDKKPKDGDISLDIGDFGMDGSFRKMNID